MNKIKASMSAILAIILMFLFCTNAIALETADDETKAYIVIDAASGQIIKEKNSNEQLDASGASKIMSQLIIMEALNDGRLALDDEVEISTNAAKAGGMSAFLSSGEIYPASELLKASFVISANDATTALAEKVAGNQAAFLEMMDIKAKELNIAPSFINITGHKADGQKISAYELATIAQEIIKYPNSMEYAKLYTDNMAHPGGRNTELVNPNKLVRFYEGCDGLGTGSNTSVGYTGIFTANKNDRRIIVVVVGAKNSDVRFSLAKELFEDAFNNYASVIAIKEGKGISKDVPVKGGVKKTVHGVAQNTVTILIKKGEEELIKKEPILFEQELSAPITKGQPIGEMLIKLGDDEIAKVNIVAYEDVELASFANSFFKVLNDYLHI